jgi:spermidine synthase
MAAFEGMTAFEGRRREGRSPLNCRRGLLFLNACFVISGATGLIYEVIWSRMLGLVFGATTFAVSAVLAAFMGGLAIGSGVGGRLGHKLSRPLRTYGYIELGVGLYAICVPSLFRVVDDLYAALWTTFSPGFIAFNLLRFILSCFVLLVPTALMGATLPVLSSALVRSGDDEPARIPRLYTCNLIGAILGTFATGFLLLPVLGVSPSILVAATLNGLIGVGWIFADRHFAATHCAKSDEPDVTSTQRENKEQAAEALALRELRETKFWLFVAAVSGFAAISAQVAWTRLLTMIIGSSTYAFSLVVALFLLGLSTGAYLVTRFKTGTDYRRVLLYVEIATAISLILSLFVANQMPAFLINAGLSHNISSWSGLLLLQILSTVMLVLLPATLMGMVMPLVLDWAGNPAFGTTSVRLVGRSYAVNTLGAILGAWSTAFVVIPVLSTRSAILISATLCLIAALFSYVPNGQGIDSELRRSLAAGIAVAAIIGMLFLAPSMNKLDLSLGAYDSLIRVLSRSQFAGLEDEAHERGDGEHRLLMYEEGPTATVSVRKDWAIISMAVNGRTNASDKGDMPTQVMLSVATLDSAPNR